MKNENYNEITKFQMKILEETQVIMNTQISFGFQKIDILLFMAIITFIALIAVTL